MQKQQEQEYELLGEAWTEDTPGEQELRNENLKKLEEYRYFDGPSILNSIDISRKVYKEGERLARQGNLRMKQVLGGYEPYRGELLGEVQGMGEGKKGWFSVRIAFSRTEVKETVCGCPACRKDYYASWRGNKTSCPYKAGLLLLLTEYLKNNNIGDATDLKGVRLINGYQKKRVKRMAADVMGKEESLRFVPRLTRKDGKLTVAFKIGTGKLFIVKKLGEFCRNVKEGAMGTYGSNTQFNHSLENFTPKGREWIRFINQIVREEEEFQQRLQERSRYYYTSKKSDVGSELSLFGWRLDEFYRQIGEERVEFDDKDSWEKKKQTLACAKRNPKVKMQIQGEYLNEEDFHGIHVSGNLPAMYAGTDTAYYIEDGYLNQVEREFLDQIEPLAAVSGGDVFSFQVGRNNLAEFYYKVLPALSEITEVKEEDPELIRSYLPPQVQYVFYLDVREGNAFCRVFAQYGDREFDVLDGLIKEADMEPFRDEAGEEEILYQAMQWFPQVDEEGSQLHCGDEEELVYQVMEHGAQKLMEFGEVRCTKRFLQHRDVKPMKVAVGVSVSSGLLELDISTEDISGEELLEILSSYREKKKYFRLKDGSFVKLEDPSLEMLSELAEAAHLKPKELIKGKMHLPMYRTLYLDKMLEEHDSVLSRRDSHFREVVKGFKTIKDADYEEPQSLSGIMRPYQKNGYKWLRTLENWKFGGILADDMGLGKTLQAIAVLLASKQEGEKGTSLIVAPASLVYNWGEECSRYAPELSISLVTGTQEERKHKIAAWQDFDLLITSYDLLKRDIAFYEDKEFRYEIIDEAQYIKNHTTAAAKAVKVIRSQIRYALTGTPIENRLSELWSIFDYLMPGFLYGYDVFKREMETPIVKNEDQGAMERLQKMTSPFILRRKKEDVLKDLPEKLEECRYVQFGNTQQRLYDGQVLHLRESIARQDEEEFSKNKLQILSELTRLRQICCHPSLCFEDYNGEAAKLEACLDLVQSAIDGGHRMLVFSQFTSMLEILQEGLQKLKIPYFTITGSTSKEKRLELVKEFNQGDVPVFLISLKAGGVGLNLTGADMVIHYDPWWNLAVQNQATDRAHRIGQTKKVTVYRLIAKNTIEEKIQKLQEKKKDLADQVIGGQTGQLGSMDREELLELLEVS